VPEVPAALKVQQDMRDRQLLGWQRLQAGDTRAATREFTELLKRSPEFYPAETGLGFVALAERQYPQAALRFSAAMGEMPATSQPSPARCRLRSPLGTTTKPLRRWRS
jgi:Tfp pilus assembly protein PilF